MQKRKNDRNVKKLLFENADLSFQLFHEQNENRLIKENYDKLLREKHSLVNKVDNLEKRCKNLRVYKEFVESKQHLCDELKKIKAECKYESEESESEEIEYSYDLCLRKRIRN